MAHSDPLRNIWTSIKTRCNHPQHKDYKNYGARGITMFMLWQLDYEEFKKWAEENGYKPGLQIDRINNNLGYSPENCHWVDNKENSNNRRTCQYVNIDGKEMSVTEACEHLGLNKWHVFGRVKQGFTHQDAIDILRRKQSE